jgi:hypothetical protein
LICGNDKNSHMQQRSSQVSQSSSSYNLTGRMSMENST